MNSLCSKITTLLSTGAASLVLVGCAAESSNQYSHEVSMEAAKATSAGHKGRFVGHNISEGIKMPKTGKPPSTPKKG